MGAEGPPGCSTGRVRRYLGKVGGWNLLIWYLLEHLNGVVRRDAAGPISRLVIGVVALYIGLVADVNPIVPALAAIYVALVIFRLVMQSDPGRPAGASNG